MGFPMRRRVAGAAVAASFGLMSLAACTADPVSAPAPVSEQATFRTQGLATGFGIDSLLLPFGAPVPFVGLGVGGSWAGVFRGFGFERAILPAPLPVPFAGLGIASDLFGGPHGFGWDVGIPYPVGPLPFAGLGRGSLLFDP